MTRLGGETVLVTGAGSGIGRLMALDVAHRGATVVAWDIHREPLDDLARKISNLGDRACAFTCDVGDRAAVLETAERVQREVGAVDVLVNNAGVVSGSPLLELTEDDIERTFRVNVLAHFWTIRAFLPAMVEQGSGHIVTIASAAGLLGIPRMTDYAASKHAAVGLAESLRLELSRTAPGVRTTLVCPSYIDTGMFEGAEVRARHLVPMLRAEDVSAAVVRAVEQDREQLLMPLMVNTISPLRVLPTRAFDATARMLGIASSMDRFVGRRTEQDPAHRASG